MLNNKLNACVVKDLDLFIDEYGSYPKNSDIYMKILHCNPAKGLEVVQCVRQLVLTA